MKERFFIEKSETLAREDCSRYKIFVVLVYKVTFSLTFY